MCNVARARSGALDDPKTPYPQIHPNGRGHNCLVLPHRRRLRQPQPERAALRGPQAALRFRGHNPRSVPATANCGASSQSAPSYATLRGSSRTSSPGGQPCPFLLPSPLAQAKVLLGTLDARDRGRAGGKWLRPGEVVDQVASHFCPAGYASVYPARSRFDSEGLVEYETLPSEKAPIAKSNSIIRKGKRALVRWEQPCSECIDRQ